MAAQDLIISRRESGLSPYLDAEPEPRGPDGASILVGIFKKRWVLLSVSVATSLALAALACWQLGRYSAIVKSTLIYTGMPASAGLSGYDPLGPATGSELIVSTRVLNQLCQKHDLGMSPTTLADYVKPSIGRSSSLLNLTLNWNNADEGISMLNDLSSIFIEEMASQRKAILREHLQHFDSSLLQAKLRVDDARQQLDALRKQQDQQLTKGGLASDQYRQALMTISNTDASIDEQKTEQIGVKEQIDRVTQNIATVTAKEDEAKKTVSDDFLHEVQTVLQTAQNRYANNSRISRQVQQTIDSISKLTKKEGAAGDFIQWQKSITDILNQENNGLSKEDQANLQKFLATVKDSRVSELRDLAVQHQSLETQREQLYLRLIPIKNQIAMLEQRQAAYQKNAEAIGEKITGITATQLDESEHRLEETEKQQDTLMMQRDNLRQLADSKLREWAVSVPASPETALLDSNHAKIFVLFFGLCGLLLSAPLVVSEWRNQSGSPQTRFARSLRVPVLAERVAEHFSPQQRKAGLRATLGDEQHQAVRMLTLRIQQSCHRAGSVVLFSSLDSTMTSAPLMAAVAECLAEREERVLLIDAESPDRSLLPVLNLLCNDHSSGAHEPAKGAVPTEVNGSRATTSDGTGLSEYLSEDCEAIGELIRPTGCPGVDLISSGSAGFPREAMASRCLTELLNTCRRNYTMILVHGPAADCAADLQMLTARADGIVLAASKRVNRDSRVRDVVQDLLDLGAPIIGLVA